MTSRMRRLALLLVVTAGSVPACRKEQPAPAPRVASTPRTTPSLKVAGHAIGRLIGTAASSASLRIVPFQTVLDREFDYLTPEWEMKWDAIEPIRGSRNFAPGDAIAAHAEARGMRLKGHTLVWHGALPPWVSALGPEELRRAFEEHVRAVVGHYRGRVLAWDVVNEAIAEDGSGLRDTVFRQKLGDGYIADAFRLAREADPRALLFYNDYGGEGLNDKSDRIYELVRDLRAQGVPIDGVGLQMHLRAERRPSDLEISSNMRRLAALGLLVTISEMDVQVRAVTGGAEARSEAQESAYHDVVRLCVLEPRCHAVTFWGFTDAQTWIRDDHPLLYDEHYLAKPAYFGVLEALSGR